ncbi:PREDICTED: THO complex subunit 6 homolog [Priapulus caudatus]|uniref:THO complex subunit 6 homolog n=1 Tax=Priapulus caudatus TaxID=37621 RepID=A0ABM1EAC9_PRICU|nr:PREDICTED: THO complex subunit 6 homolog [Priapulus caudatus]
MAAPIPKDGKQSDPRYQLFTTVYATCFSPCGRYLVAGNNFGKIAVYSLSSALSPDATEENKAPLYIYRAHDGPIYSFSSTDTFLISAGTRDVLGWKWKDLIAREPKVAWVLAIPRGDGFESPETNALALSNTSNGTQTLYAGCGDNNIYGWELDTGTCVMTMKGHSDFVHCLATKNSGNELVSGSEDGSVRIWDPRCPEEHVQMFEPSKHDVSLPFLFAFLSQLHLLAKES